MEDINITFTTATEKLLKIISDTITGRDLNPKETEKYTEMIKTFIYGRAINANNIDINELKELFISSKISETVLDENGKPLLDQNGNFVKTEVNTKPVFMENQWEEIRR